MGGSRKVGLSSLPEGQGVQKLQWGAQSSDGHLRKTALPATEEAA